MHRATGQGLAGRGRARARLAEGLAGPGVSGPAGRTRSSWRAEVMASLVNTWLRWYWAVRGLMNSRAPISGLDSLARLQLSGLRIL